MKRRGFLGLFGGAVVSGPTITKGAFDTTIADSGFGSGVAGVAPCLPSIPTSGVTGKVISWIKKVGVPNWKMEEIKRSADHRRAFGLDPDIACLRSVSSGWKAREQRRRNIERQLASSLSSIENEAERRRFRDKLRAKFGDGIGWYE